MHQINVTLDVQYTAPSASSMWEKVPDAGD